MRGCGEKNSNLAVTFLIMRQNGERMAGGTNEMIVKMREGAGRCKEERGKKEEK